MKFLHKIVIPKIASEWKIVAIQLDYDISTINLIAETGKEDPIECCTELFTNWLTTDNGIAPKTWSTLINTFQDIDHLSRVAKEIKKLVKREHGVVQSDVDFVCMMLIQLPEFCLKACNKLTYYGYSCT